MRLARLRRIRKMLKKRQSGLTVVLENIYDPYNAEAVFRSCDAFGVQDVHVIKAQRGRRVRGAIRNTTSGSARKWLCLHYYDCPEVCLEKLKAQGYQLVATVASDEAETTLYESDLYSRPIALLLGNEHAGLTTEVINLSDMRLTIPMNGLVQSLNLSVTASIILYEATRQRKAAGTLKALPQLHQRQLFRDIIERVK
ncbi:RNA methyltransferase [bacterium]|nr:RNA methyltransferase [bacterium]